MKKYLWDKPCRPFRDSDFFTKVTQASAPLRPGLCYEGPSGQFKTILGAYFLSLTHMGQRPGLQGDMVLAA